jgi:lysophospholipase L1-like esterase
MGTAYGIPSCIGWYRATTGVYSDAGTTPANPGDGVYQWNDQSGDDNHLIQTTAGNRPVFNTYAASLTTGGAAAVAPYGDESCVYQPSGKQSLLFDGSTSFLNIPTSLAIPNSGCTVVLCTRGAYYSPISFGTDGITTINYGWVGGSPQRMAIYNSANRTFPIVTYLPTLSPIVHGFRGSALLNETRLYIGTNQTAAINSNWCNLAMTGGAVGRTLGLSDPTYGNYSFGGEIYEIAIFSAPIIDSYMQVLLSQMQAANQLPGDANSGQVIFIGDSLTTGGPGTPTVSQGYPSVLVDQYGGSIKPLMLAVPGHTIAQQQSLVTNQVSPLDLSPFVSTVAVVCCGSNDIAAGRTDSQVAADLATLCSGLRATGMKVIIAMLTPRNSSSGYTSGNITTLNNVNAAIRSGYSAYADALVDWAGDSRLSDCTNSLYFADQWNTTSAGDGVKAELIKPALDVLLSPPKTVLSYASFYTPGRSFAGNYGKFLRT